MGKYVVLVECLRGDIGDTGVRTTLSGGVVDFDGSTGEVVDHYTRKTMYGGDEDGCPEQYARIESMYQMAEVYAVPFENLLAGGLMNFVKAHNAWHDEQDERKLEEKEKNELARLKAKYEVDKS